PPRRNRAGHLGSGRGASGVVCGGAKSVLMQSFATADDVATDVRRLTLPAREVFRASLRRLLPRALCCKLAALSATLARPIERTMNDGQVSRKVFLRLLGH